MIFNVEEYEQLRRCWDCERNDCPILRTTTEPISTDFRTEDVDNSHIRKWIQEIMAEQIRCPLYRKGEAE